MGLHFKNYTPNQWVLSVVDFPRSSWRGLPIPNHTHMDHNIWSFGCYFLMQVIYLEAGTTLKESEDLEGCTFCFNTSICDRVCARKCLQLLPTYATLQFRCNNILIL